MADSEQRRSVLLVEDDPELTSVVINAFTEMNFDVAVVVDYQAAIRMLRERAPTLVCLDLNLPRDSGYDVCEFIRKELQNEWLPIIIMSDRRSPEEMAYAEEAGANAYLKKPFTLSLLEKYVRHVLDGPQSSRPDVRRLLPSSFPPPVITKTKT